MRIGWTLALFAVLACGRHQAAHHDATGDGLNTTVATCTTDTDCAGAKCCTGVCVVTADCSFAVTNVSPALGFVNGGEWFQLTGTGFAPGMKVFIGDGRAPVRVSSPTTAVIQTPPGPAGVTDVRIELGTQTATLLKGFTYRIGGLEQEWEQKPLQVVRGEDPGLAVMQDGRVLIAGGTPVPDSDVSALATAEIYDRISDTVAPAANAMSTQRWHASAITLLTGKVLVVGATCDACTGDGTRADLFDPTTNTFTPTAHPLNRPRTYPRSVLLTDGRVVISSENDPTLELYDPDTDTFTVVPHTQLHRYGFVVRLRDGRVLIGAGDGGVTAAELLDFDAGTDTATASPLVQGRSMVTAHTLPSGKVAIIGGASVSAGGITVPLASIELFDPATNTFATAPYQLATPRCWHASALVRDGTVLAMGGYTIAGMCNSGVATVEQIDPLFATVTPFPTLLNTNTEWTAVTLLDGSILGVGGGACGTSMALPDIDFLKGAPIQ